MEFDDLVNLAVVLAVLALAVASVIATLYIRWVNRQRSEPSRYLDMLVNRDTRTGIAQAILAVLLVYLLLRLVFGFPPLPPPVGAIGLGVPFLLMGWGPVADAMQFRTDRRMGRNGFAE